MTPPRRSSGDRQHASTAQRRSPPRIWCRYRPAASDQASSPPGSSGTVAGGTAGALNWDLSAGSRRRPHYYTREFPMQQWLNLVPMAGALLNLAAAMTNLASTIINRRGTTSDQVDDDIAH